jgi:hypothetical protein
LFAAVLTLAASIAFASDTVPFGFGPSTVPGPGLGEPSMSIGADGTIYTSSIVGLAGPLTEDAVYGSTDHGATWYRSGFHNPVVGGNDDNVLVAPDGAVYVNGQWFGSACQSVARLSPGAHDLEIIQPIVCDRPNTDRAWLTYSGDADQYSLYAYFHSPCCNGSHGVFRSDDRGVTWLKAGTAFSDGGFPGNIISDPSGTLYAATVGYDFGAPAVEVATSLDKGKTWEQRYVSYVLFGDGGLNHVFVTIDDAGNLYTAWTGQYEGSGFDVWFSRSADGGQTWTPRARVAAAVGAQVYPTIDAAARGHVVIAWYESTLATDPNTTSATTFWHPRAARSFDADGATPTWSLTDVAGAPNHRGRLCTKGAACAADRGMLDFFSVQIDPDGHANIVWAQDIGGVRQLRFARSLSP